SLHDEGLRPAFCHALRARDWRPHAQRSAALHVTVPSFSGDVWFTARGAETVRWLLWCGCTVDVDDRHQERLDRCSRSIRFSEPLPRHQASSPRPPRLGPTRRLGHCLRRRAMSSEARELPGTRFAATVARGVKVVPSVESSMDRYSYFEQLP